MQCFFFVLSTKGKQSQGFQKTARHTTNTCYHMSTISSSLVRPPVIITGLVSPPPQHSISHSGRILKAALLVKNLFNSHFCHASPCLSAVFPNRAVPTFGHQGRAAELKMPLYLISQVCPLQLPPSSHKQVNKHKIF